MPPEIQQEELEYVRVKPGIYLQNDAVDFCGHFGTMMVGVRDEYGRMVPGCYHSILNKEYGAILLLRLQRSIKLPTPEAVGRLIHPFFYAGAHDKMLLREQVVCVSAAKATLDYISTKTEYHVRQQWAEKSNRAIIPASPPEEFPEPLNCADTLFHGGEHD